MTDKHIPAMPDYQHHFTPLDPPLGRDELPKVQALGYVDFHTEAGYRFIVRLLGFDEVIRAIAITIPAEAATHSDLNKWFEQIVEDMITAIRLTADSQTHPIYTTMGFLSFMYESDDHEPSYQVALDHQEVEGYKLDVSNVLAVMGEVSTKDLSPLAALLAESELNALPPHYRVLSAIRAIELLHGSAPQWDRVLDAYQAQFEALKISDARFKNALPKIRTRCAHGRSNGRQNPKPFVGIGYNEPSLMPLLDLLQKMVSDGIRERFSLTVNHTPRVFSI